MSKMSELHIKYTEKNYNNLSEEEKNYLNSINIEYLFWEQNCDNSP